METKFYVNADGKYLGGFAGILPPVGSFEVPTAPTDAMMTWSGKEWIVPADKKNAMIDKDRYDAYSEQGATFDKLIVALWKRVVENDPTSSDEIEKIRKQVQKEFPR